MLYTDDKYAGSVKRVQNFFVMSFIKLSRFWWNLVGIQNICAAKLYKRFPPSLNSVFMLHCETGVCHSCIMTAMLMCRHTVTRFLCGTVVLCIYIYRSCTSTRWCLGRSEWKCWVRGWSYFLILLLKYSASQMTLKM